MKYNVTKTACMARGSPASGGTSENDATAANAELFVVNIRLAAIVVGLSSRIFFDTILNSNPPPNITAAKSSEFVKTIVGCAIIIDLLMPIMGMIMRKKPQLITCPLIFSMEDMSGVLRKIRLMMSGIIITVVMIVNTD